MSLTIRSRLYILALVPLLVIAIGMLSFTYMKTTELNEQQIKVTHTNMTNMKKAELKNYIQMAKSALEPLLARGASLEEALPTLKSL
ncbi:chemotaxis protein, partial [Vibrio sp. M260118]